MPWLCACVVSTTRKFWSLDNFHHYLPISGLNFPFWWFVSSSKLIITFGTHSKWTILQIFLLQVIFIASNFSREIVALLVSTTLRIQQPCMFIGVFELYVYFNYLPSMPSLPACFIPTLINCYPSFLLLTHDLPRLVCYNLINSILHPSPMWWCVLIIKS